MSRNPQVEQGLMGLRDLAGVVGSLVISGRGLVIAQDFPAYFGSAADEVAPRALRLREAVEAAGQSLDSLKLHFGSHLLVLQPIAHGLLGILCDADVNGPALRMASQLVARRLERTISEVDLSPLPQPPNVRPSGPASSARGQLGQEAPGQMYPSGAAAPEATTSRTTLKSRPVYYRGRRVR